MENKTIKINGINIFYREIGDQSKTTILMLHGYPSSSHMFRDIMDELKNDFHLIAPDFPGFGFSEQPSRDKFNYTFQNIADLMKDFTNELGLEKWVLFMQDYGGPVGFRMAVAEPHRIQALITQNANAYEEGLLDAWAPIRKLWDEPTQENKDAVAINMLGIETTKFLYQEGAKSPVNIGPETYHLDQLALDREGNREVQLDLFYDYRNNVKDYPKWQHYFREHQPSILVVWGENDPFFGTIGAKAFAKDIKDIEVHLFDTGHFALEEEYESIAALTKSFIEKRV
jgi:pimeloyl-ACP methyl ester carboxylesterase